MINLEWFIQNHPLKGKTAYLNTPLLSLLLSQSAFSSPFPLSLSLSLSLNHPSLLGLTLLPVSLSLPFSSLVSFLLPPPFPSSYLSLGDEPVKNSRAVVRWYFHQGLVASCQLPPTRIGSKEPSHCKKTGARFCNCFAKKPSTHFKYLLIILRSLNLLTSK